jgi:hypothetical protein
MHPYREVLDVKRYVSWALIAVLVMLAAGRFYASREGVVYRPSNPALVSATGRPQLVEFYHRA